MCISLSKNHHLSNFKLFNLAICLTFVKAIVLFPCASFAQSFNADIVIAQGEQKELSFAQVKKFSVGNPGVISYHVVAKTGKILIKGKKVGFSDIMIWDQKGKSTLSVYVLSKQKFLKTFQLAESLKNLNLTIDIKGPVMTAQGSVVDFSDYLYLQKIKAQYQDQIFFKISLDPALRNHIVGQIYKKLYANGVSSVSCQADWMDITCFHEGHDHPNLFKQLANHYRVTFVQEDSKFRHRNYRLKLKLIQLERMDGREIHLGLDKLQAKIGDLFDFGIRRLIEDNSVYLSKSNTELSSLAEPEMVVNLQTPQTIEIGSQIPYQNISTQGSSVIAPIDWRFAGLKIKTQLVESYGKFRIDYETEFSRPMGQSSAGSNQPSISGSKEISSALLELGRPIKIFQIGFQTTAKDRQGIPVLSDIPLLKHLFESKSDQRTYKQLYGYVVLEEVE